jgi:cytochrome-b5 reductase
MTEERKISRLELARHKKEGDLWFAIEGKVYDVSGFREHPGGIENLLENAGKDATDAFMNQGHGVKARNMMKTFEVGTFVGGAEEEVTVVRQKPKNANGLLLVVLAIVALAFAYRFLL